MKPYYFYALGLALVISCSKSEFQETKDTILGANELLKTAKEGLSSIDSISTLVRDSAEFNRVVVPQIEKHKQTAERLIKGNAKSLDSINAVLKETATRVRSSTELLKTVDSARLEIGESSSPWDILSTVTKTLDKLSDQTKKSPEASTQSTEQSSVSSQDSEPTPSATADPKLNSMGNLPQSEAKMKLSVEDLDLANQALQNGIHLYDARVQSDSYGEVQGRASRELTLQIPSRHFEQALAYFGTNLGTLRTKSIQSWSRNGSSNELSSLVLTLEQSSLYSGSPIAQSPDTSESAPATYKDQSKNAFMQGFDYLRDAVLLLLPFWPLILLLALGLYFWRRSKAKARAKAQREPFIETPTSYSSAPTSPAVNQSPTTEQSENGENSRPETNSKDPYDKYKPKF